MSNDIYLLDKNRSVVDATGKEISKPEVRSAVVLFLSKGRNAWHSTWVRRYWHGSFFRDGRAINIAVSKRRTRGTVFYLSVIPAFLFNFGLRKFLVTEINSTEPFRYIDLEEARYGSVNHNLSAFLDAMEPSSPLWKPQQSKRDSIIVQEVGDNFLDISTYMALSKGRDKVYNPPIGRYRRMITGTFLGESEWFWEADRPDNRNNAISLRWYYRALEALAESHERTVAGY